MNFDYIAPEIAIPLIVLVWGVLILIWVRERAARKRERQQAQDLIMKLDSGEWGRIDRTGTIHRESQFFDQDENQENQK